LIHKAKTEEPKTVLLQRQTGLTHVEAEDTRWDRMACVEATQGAVAGHPSDGEDMKTSK
jgi:hypothetical protein